MRTIYKFPVPITDRFTLEMPVRARILNAFVQNASAFLWAEVETNMEMETRKFAVIGTGNPMPEGIKCHIATFPMRAFIWHLYEMK